MLSRFVKLAMLPVFAYVGWIQYEATQAENEWKSHVDSRLEYDEVFVSAHGWNIAQLRFEHDALKRHVSLMECELEAVRERVK